MNQHSTVFIRSDEKRQIEDFLNLPWVKPHIPDSGTYKTVFEFAKDNLDANPFKALFLQTLAQNANWQKSPETCSKLMNISEKEFNDALSSAAKVVHTHLESNNTNEAPQKKSAEAPPKTPDTKAKDRIRPKKPSRKPITKRTAPPAKNTKSNADSATTPEHSAYYKANKAFDLPIETYFTKRGILAGVHKKAIEILSPEHYRVYALFKFCTKSPPWEISFRGVAKKLEISETDARIRFKEAADILQPYFDSSHTRSIISSIPSKAIMQRGKKTNSLSRFATDKKVKGFLDSMDGKVPSGRELKKILIKAIQELTLDALKIHTHLHFVYPQHRKTVKEVAEELNLDVREVTDVQSTSARLLAPHINAGHAFESASIPLNAGISFSASSSQEVGYTPAYLKRRRPFDQTFGKTISTFEIRQGARTHLDDKTRELFLATDLDKESNTLLNVMSNSNLSPEQVLDIRDQAQLILSEHFESNVHPALRPLFLVEIDQSGEYVSWPDNLPRMRRKLIFPSKSFGEVNGQPITILKGAVHSQNLLGFHIGGFHV